MPAPTHPPADDGEARSFQDQTRVEPAGGDGRYHAHLGPGWSAPVHPSGGLVAALAIRAMEAELGVPRHRLRTFTTMFVSMVKEGPLEIEVRVLRRGRRMSQLQALVRNVGREEPGHVTTAAFGEAREGFSFTHTAAPEVGPPESYPEPEPPPDGAIAFKANFWDNIATRRIRLFHSFEEGWEGGRAEALRWMRYHDTPRTADGAFNLACLPALADTMPSAVTQYLGPGYPFFHCPSVDLTMHLLDPPEGDWLLTRSTAHWAGDGYASADTELWDAAGRLVAHGTQVMLVRFPDPATLGAGPVTGQEGPAGG